MIVGDVSEPGVLDKFVRGLRLPVEEYIRIQSPKTIGRTMELALYYEGARGGVHIPRQTLNRQLDVDRNPWDWTTPRPIAVKIIEVTGLGRRNRLAKNP